MVTVKLFKDQLVDRNKLGSFQPQSCIIQMEGLLYIAAV